MNPQQRFEAAKPERPAGLLVFRGEHNGHHILQDADGWVRLRDMRITTGGRLIDEENLLAVYFVVMTPSTRKRRELGVAYLIDGTGPLYAVVGMDSPALSVTVNFGAEAPFTLPDERRRLLEDHLCRSSAWAGGYPPGMAPEGDSDDSDGDFDESDTSDEE